MIMKSRFARIIGMGLTASLLLLMFSGTVAAQMKAPPPPPTEPDLETRVDDVTTLATEAALAGHNGWMLVSCALVLFMTAPGLAMFYSGLVRKKNVLGVMMQCIFSDGSDDRRLGTLGVLAGFWGQWQVDRRFRVLGDAERVADVGRGR